MRRWHLLVRRLLEERGHFSVCLWLSRQWSHCYLLAVLTWTINRLVHAQKRKAHFAKRSPRCAPIENPTGGMR